MTSLQFVVVCLTELGAVSRRYGLPVRTVTVRLSMRKITPYLPLYVTSIHLPTGSGLGLDYLFVCHWSEAVAFSRT